MITNTAFNPVEQYGTYDATHAQLLGFDDDEEALAALLSIMTNIYSNPSLAVVREYSSNARDSHVAADSADRPIEVTLPTRIEPQLRIQDYGVGLTKDEILSVYARYGSSTKRKSNEFIGAMGIGSKSAFTVGNQFTVTGVKDGQKTIAFFMLNANGQPTVDILHEAATDEINGVLVDIGVENVNAVREAADELFRYWRPGTVLVDGDVPDSIWPNLETLTDGEHYLKRDYGFNYNEHVLTLIMGGVPYVVKMDDLRNTAINADSLAWLSKGREGRAQYYVEINIGAVDITPSREELRITQHTIATIDKVLAGLQNSVNDLVTSWIDEADTITEAAMKVKDAEKLFPQDHRALTWKGRSLGSGVQKMDYTSYKLEKTSHRYNANWKVGALAPTLVTFANDVLNDVVVITNVPDGKLNTVRRYAKIFLTNGNHKVTLIASSVAQDSHGWFEYGGVSKVKTITFEDYRAKGMELMSLTPNGRTAGTISYDATGVDDPLTPEEINGMDMKVAYFEYGVSPVRSDGFVRDALQDYLIITLRKGQRAETLEKRVPGSVHYKNVIRDHVTASLNSLTKEDKELLEHNKMLAHTSSSAITQLKKYIDEGLITNSGLLDLVHAYNVAKSNVKTSAGRITRIGDMARYVGRESEILGSGRDIFADVFPLFILGTENTWRMSNINKDQDLWKSHMVAYLNSVTVV